MRVFLTGATGFIGGHVVPRLLQDHHELRCLVRRRDAARRLEQQGATLVEGDVTDRESVKKAMPGCKWVIHLANLYSFWEADPVRYARVNIVGTRHVMETAAACGITKGVHVSSAVVYGKPDDVPFREESAFGATLDTEYARTKAVGDEVAREVHEQSGLPLVTIQPGAVVGPGDTKATGDYIRSLVERRMPARVCEDTVFTFVHVRDVAEAITRAAAKEGNDGEDYLVGAERFSFGEINRMVSEIAGVPLPALRMPAAMAAVAARLLTWMADRTGQPPPWGLSVDQVRMMRRGFAFDGTKAQRELGITYTPVRVAIEEMIADIRSAGALGRTRDGSGSSPGPKR